MIILDTVGDTIQAEASAATSLTISCYGIESSGGTKTYKKLGQAQLTGSGTQDTIYTVPAFTSTICSVIIVSNTTASSHTINIWHVPSGGSPADNNSICKNITIPGNKFLIWNRGEAVIVPSPTDATDHGALSGLSDDDHTQYLLADGTRDLTGNQLVTGAIRIQFRDTALYVTSNSDGVLDLVADSAITFSAPSVNFGGDAKPTIDVTNDLGSSSFRWNNAYILNSVMGSAANNVTATSTGITYAGTARPKKTIVLTAAGGWPSTTSGCANNTKIEYGSNYQNLYFLDFDPDTSEFAQWTIVMPDSYDGGTIKAKFIWTCTGSSGGGDVVWAFQGRAYTDGDSIDQLWGSSQTVTDTIPANDTVQISSETSDITLAGSPAGGQLVQFRAYRDGAAAGDTLNVDARLIAVVIEYTITQEGD